MQDNYFIKLRSLFKNVLKFYKIFIKYFNILLFLNDNILYFEFQYPIEHFSQYLIHTNRNSDMQFMNYKYFKL